ncbi:hypothetical protein [Heyndrickxia vini]|uniref:Peptidase M50 domain-containing protein n=1 Tax=Heyndrickxia vini TaxID=1476025 RepID=A0ABX7E2L3_9BACI|nr:hypothetical protein [Heyndrickxia vini]QQZ09816.1 hypothetical protein I5776_02225 [Heyndrickxia vini]
MVLLFLFLFIAAPITIFIHEFGHALGSLLMRADKIEMNIGSGRKIYSIHCYKWTINVYLLYILGAHTFSEREPYFSKLEQIVITAFGPLLNGVVWFIFQWWIPIHSQNIWQLFALFNLWLFLVNLIPFKIGGKQSDGYTILQKLLTKKVD